MDRKLVQKKYHPLANRSNITSQIIYQGTEEDDILNTEWERILYEVEDDGGILKGKQLESKYYFEFISICLEDSVISKKDIVMNARK